MNFDIDIVTSDLHFGHVNIMKYCPQRFEYLDLDVPASLVERCRDEQARLNAGEKFESEIGSTEIAPFVPAMNEAIVALWNRQVSPDDTVLVVGDVAMGKVAETIENVRRLNGRKILALGNHDKPHPICVSNQNKREDWSDVYTDVGFESQFFAARASFDGVVTEICHFPYVGDHSEDRYNADTISQYVPADEGYPLVHGHIHDMWTQRGRMYNVGIDAYNGVFQTVEAIGAYFRGIGYTG